MKQLSILLICLIANVANAANWYVRPAYAVGSHNGTDWNNAWSDFSINWNSISPGDTIWMSGGTYSQTLAYNKSGTAGNPITVKLATSLDPIPTGAAGWIPALSATAYIVAQNYIAFNFQSYVTFDGNANAGPYGGVIVGPVAGGSENNCAVTLFAQGFTRSGPNHTDVRCQYVTIVGPNYGGVLTASPGGTAFMYGQNGGTFCTNVYIGHCFSDGCNQAVYTQGWVNGTVEYCRFNNLIGCNCSTQPHNNLWFIWDGINMTWRYNIAYNMQGEALEFGYIGQGGGPMGNIQIYGNVFDGGGIWDVHNFISPTVAYFYNNTLVNISLEHQPNGPGSPISFPATNNIMWGFNLSSPYNQEQGNCDYNYYSASSWLAAPDTHSIVNSANPFVNITPGTFNTNQDYHLKAGSIPVNAGAVLASDGFLNKDMDGNARGANGGWDIGAYELGGAPSTNPVILVTPSSLNFGYLLTNTSSTNSFTVQNIGQGTLVGTATVGGGPFSLITSLGPSSYSLTNGQTQTISVKFNPTSVGTFSGTASFSGGGGATPTVSGVGLPAFNVGQTFLATNGAISGPFSLTSTGAVYMVSEIDAPASSGQAAYWISIPTTGTYEVNGYIQSPSGSANSAYITFDTPNIEANTVWDMNTNAVFTWNLANNRGTGTFDNDQFQPMIWNLSAGYHQLLVGGREAGTYLGAWQVIAQASTNPPPPNGLRLVRVTP